MLFDQESKNRDPKSTIWQVVSIALGLFGIAGVTIPPWLLDIWNPVVLFASIIFVFLSGASIGYRLCDFRRKRDQSAAVRFRLQGFSAEQLKLLYYIYKSTSGLTIKKDNQTAYSLQEVKAIYALKTRENPSLVYANARETWELHPDIRSLISANFDIFDDVYTELWHEPPYAHDDEMQYRR